MILLRFLEVWVRWNAAGAEECRARMWVGSQSMTDGTEELLEEPGRVDLLSESDLQKECEKGSITVA